MLAVMLVTLVSLADNDTLGRTGLGHIYQYLMLSADCLDISDEPCYGLGTASTKHMLQITDLF